MNYFHSIIKPSQCILWALLLSLSLFSCKDEEEPVGPPPQASVTIQGTIYGRVGTETPTPLSGAEVAIRSTFSNPDTQMTASDGKYQFVLNFPSGTTSGSVFLTVTKENYYVKSDSFTVESGKTYSSKDYTLSRRVTPVDTTGKGPASIIFISASSPFANVRGVGGVENVLYTFEVRDSSGLPIGSGHKAKVRFSISPAVGGGEFLIPTSGYTGAGGRITTVLNSGDRSGIVQIEAVMDSPVVKSAVAPPTPIYSGPPDARYFTLAIEKLNFPGLGFLGVQNKVSVQVGDKWGNPVREGTSVYFSTSAGVIGPIGATDIRGRTEVILVSGNPFPSDGFGYVTAQTVGESGVIIKDSIRVLFSGQPQISPADTNFVIPNGGQVRIHYRVFDQNRNPLAGGTNIKVEFSGGATSELVFTGDLDRTLPDTQDSSYTFFAVNIRDTSLQTPESKILIMSIRVSGPNGTTQRSYSGVLLGTGVGVVEVGKPATITLYGLSTNQIYVRGGGANESAVITFLVRDLRGNPLPQDSAIVNFALEGVGGGAVLFPTSVKTDAFGRVQTTLTSGTKAGVLQVIASTDTGIGPPVKSSPIPITVASGLPHDSHVGIAVEKFNLPGLITYGLTDEVTVFVGDQYGNPVQPNTAVYFATDGGIIKPAGFTNQNGIATTILHTGAPAPPNGRATISASTLSENGVKILKNATVVFSGHPIITSEQDSVIIDDGSTTVLNYFVHDLNNNPLSSGTTIKVSLDGPPLISELKLSGDVSITLPDVLSGWTNFSVTIRDTGVNNLTQGAFSVVISVDGPNGALIRHIPGRLKPSTNPPIKNLVLVSIGDRRLTVRNTGQLDSSIIVYEIQDDRGRTIPLANIPVDFISTGAVGSFRPSRAYTNAIGQARTVFFSGADTGTATIIAQTGEVVSRPVTITIVSGPPKVLKLFATRPPDTIPKVNYPGASSSVSEPMGEIRLQVTDRYGNPVAAGTQVNLTTNAGVLRSQTTFTNRQGLVKVEWNGGAPLPPGGVAVVSASTIGELSQTVRESVVVTYSGDPIVNLQLSSNFVFRNQIDTTIIYSVRDANGNPLAQGATFQVSVSGANSVLLSDSINVKMPDTRDPNAAIFRFRLRDTNTVVTDDRPISITIRVSGPNGSTQLTTTGTLLGAVPPPFRIIALENISSTRISVAGVNALDSSVLKYQLTDSANRPIRMAGITVFFTSTGVGGRFNPQSAITNSLGQVQTTFFSGTVAETVQVRANASGISSQPQSIIIEGGPPVQSFFTFSLHRPPDPAPKVNFPGAFSLPTTIGEARVQAKDIYGNVVKPYTPISFTTNAGTIQSIAYTDANGVAKAQWRGGPPIPAGGVAVVKAEAKDALGNLLAVDSAIVTYSGQAVISGGLSPNFVFRRGIDTTITYSVKDVNNNPLAEGAMIRVVASGTGASSVILSGDVNVTMTDTRSPSATLFSFRLRDTNTIETGLRPLIISILVSGVNGSAAKLDTGALHGAPIPNVAAITLESMTNTQLTVKGGNGPENTMLTYQLRDSVGNVLKKDNVLVTFGSFGVAGTFSPASVLTDINGQAKTVFSSDTVAGIVQIYAEAGSVVSNRVKLVIVGGKPAQAYFTFMLTDASGNNRVNYPGIITVGKIGEARVRAGDRYGNPVPAGTPIYFTTNAGVIQGQALTDEFGFAKVDWFGGNPIPSNGVAIIKASALGYYGEVIADSAVVTYSGQVAISGGLESNFVLRNGIDTTVIYRVKDISGNPIAAGSIISVTVSGTGSRSIILSGDINTTSPDTRDTNLTFYSFRLRDTNTVITTQRDLTVLIQVSGPNGSAQLLSSGTLQGAAQVGGRTRLPGQIALISISNQNIQVVGTGGIETSTIIWEVRDSLGIPVDSAYKVKFSFTSQPGGAFISPDSGLCDPTTGRINSVVHSGTISGVVQVLAQVISPTDVIYSTPVRLLINAGLPDSLHFTVYASRINVPGLVLNNQTSTISVIVGDKYGNPVAENTAVYFTTNIGIVTTNTGFTDQNGRASVTLMSANPRPAGGFGYVYARTVGENGVTVTDSVRILFSGDPIIDNLTFDPAPIVDDNNTFTVRFRVYDVNSNPMAGGTRISIAIQGASAVVSYVAPSSTLPDTQDPYWTEFSAVIAKDVQTGTTGAFIATIMVTGPNGSASRSFTGTVN